MACAHFVKKAQKNIYINGKIVQYESKKGKRAGQMLSKRDRTTPENKNDKILIAKGESYYWWAFQHGGIHYSKTAPRQSQLTQSNYLSQLYSIQEQIEDFTCDNPEDFSSFVDNMIDELENLRDETQGSLDNMPDSLQQGPTGELLQERIDSLDNAINDLEYIDKDYDEPDEAELKEEAKEDGVELEELKQEKVQEWLDEKMEELKGISFE